MRSTEQNARGFSLVELMVAMTLGLIVLAATTQLFKSGMDATILVTQSSEMQQSVRATLNLIAKDVSMAGSGLPSGGLALPNGAGSVASLFAVDANRAWLANNAYPGTIYVRHHSRRQQRYGIRRAGQRHGHGHGVRRDHDRLRGLFFPTQSVHNFDPGRQPEWR